MKYRLKDRAMQAKLDALSGGDFSLKLQEQVTPYKLTLTFVEVGFSREKGKNTRWFTATFRTDEIEKVPEYDPNAWNGWPAMEPPEDVLMQVEFKEKDKETLYRSCWKWSGYEWIWGDGRPMASVRTDRLREIRFRPWGDQE